MEMIIHSKLFLITLSVAVYYASQLLYKRLRWTILNPILVAVVVIIAVLLLLDVSFEEYYAANEVLNFLLGVSVVSLGYLLYDNIEQIRGRERAILFSTFVGSFVGVASVVVLGRLMNADQTIICSIAPKSVTMPIAIALSEYTGGNPSLTSIAVIFAGIFGSVVGPSMLRLMGVHSPIAVGLALGSGSHAVGTARAMELGAVQGAVSGAAIGLMGVFTSLAIPIIDWVAKML